MAEDETGNPEQVWQGETSLGAKITLNTAPHLGDGLVFNTRMTDPDDGRWFSVYLDRDAITALGGTLVGFSLGQVFKDLGKAIDDS